jgi:hypothetical protein
MHKKLSVIIWLSYIGIALLTCLYFLFEEQVIACTDVIVLIGLDALASI